MSNLTPMGKSRVQLVGVLQASSPSRGGWAGRTCLGGGDATTGPPLGRVAISRVSKR